ncbi:hypothetical protein SARC_00386 [Sphaeroforma arctica JP610]|uniref:P-type ATPase C-terminal domain-containing protein n=1 Tax=Sphaeroforma arctica JP610 TaxID=667725 RepID=A0A0L0GF57_9EUKA|nr:hypothetical protein SARC_00386 [Sphaeroforma arctica JP610]KNC87501.1 hypothetical protein SARC_00386 [Sphaeroforma arctica JP610]|eukprot:XP_014161403.1 hypothetical protein SARC_00386 [Sphaeroforma arctica JP610]
MLNAVWASLAIFFTTYLTYRDTEIGIWEFGTIMNTAMVVVVNVQLAMVSKNITWLNGLVLVGSVLAMFVFMFVFAVVPTELYYVAFVTVSDCRYWFIVLLASWLALFPQLVGQYLWQNELSGPLDRLRAKERTEHETRHDKERFQNAVAREPLPMATIDQSEKKKEVYGAEYPAYSRTPSALMSVPITLSSTSLASNGGV